jgi:hypothetical protein
MKTPYLIDNLYLINNFNFYQKIAYNKNKVLMYMFLLETIGLKELCSLNVYVSKRNYFLIKIIDKIMCFTW